MAEEGLAAGLLEQVGEQRVPEEAQLAQVRERPARVVGLRLVGIRLGRMQTLATVASPAASPGVVIRFQDQVLRTTALVAAVSTASRPRQVQVRDQRRPAVPRQARPSAVVIPHPARIQSPETVEVRAQAAQRP